MSVSHTSRRRVLSTPDAARVWVVTALVLFGAGCRRAPQPGIAHRLELPGIERIEIGREVREVLPPGTEHEVEARLTAGCTVHLGVAITGTGDGSATFRYGLHSGEGPASSSAAFTPDRSGSWHDVGIAVPPAGASTLHLSIEGPAAGRGRWSRPVAVCPRSPQARVPKNVILLSLDTLRADRLGALGNPNGLTPHLDALAAAGTLFERAYAQYPSTLASHASLMTGHYPSELGIDERSGLWTRIQAETLAAAFSRHGYLTTGFTENAYVSSSFGFSIGFDRYHHGPAGGTALATPGAAAATVRRAVSWLESRPDAPFFLFLHTYQVHTPYTPDPSLLEQRMARTDATYVGKYEAAFEDRLLGLAHLLHRKRISSVDLAQMERLYDAEVMGVDREVGHLVQALGGMELDDSTILVVLSDHGEAFGEHGEILHGQTLQEEVLRVPLVFWGPGTVPAGVRVGGLPVALMDAGVTAADLAGLGRVLPAAPARSLRPLMEGAAPPSSEPIRSELASSVAACGEGDLRGGQLTACPVDGVALRDLRYTYVRYGVAGREVLFDRSVDSSESVDIAAQRPELAASYRAIAESVRTEPSGPSPESGSAGDTVELDADTEGRLRTLGYLE